MARPHSQNRLQNVLFTRFSGLALRSPVVRLCSPVVSSSFSRASPAFSHFTKLFRVLRVPRNTAPRRIARCYTSDLISSGVKGGLSQQVPLWRSFAARVSIFRKTRLERASPGVLPSFFSRSLCVITTEEDSLCHCNLSFSSAFAFSFSRGLFRRSSLLGVIERTGEIAARTAMRFPLNLRLRLSRERTRLCL